MCVPVKKAWQHPCLVNTCERVSRHWLVNNYPAKSRGISPDTASSAKIRGYSARLNRIIDLLFNTKLKTRFIILPFFSHTKLRISQDIC